VSGVRRRIKITVETESVLVLRRRAASCRAWCAVCFATTAFAPLAEACELTASDAATVRRLLAAGRLHSIEASDGSPLVCLRSALTQPAG
jgi:hypothetical protein